MVNPFINLTDEELMLLYQEDNFMAFEVLYERHKKKVYTFLNKRLTSKNDIEDIYQSVFIKIHKSRQNYSTEHTLLKWIYVISRSELYDAAKKKKLNLVEFNENQHETTLNLEDNDELEINIDNEKLLSPNEKDAIRMRYLDDNEFSQISDALSTTEQNTRKIISRGLAKLKKKYKGVKS